MVTTTESTQAEGLEPTILSLNPYRTALESVDRNACALLHSRESNPIHSPETGVLTVVVVVMPGADLRDGDREATAYDPRSCSTQANLSPQPWILWMPISESV